MVDSTTPTSSFLTSAQYADQQMSAGWRTMTCLGRDAFLQLLDDPADLIRILWTPWTTRLLSLSWRSSRRWKGLKGCRRLLESMSSAMRQDQMIAGANLMGKGVLVPGGTFSARPRTRSGGLSPAPIWFGCLDHQCS